MYEKGGCYVVKKTHKFIIFCWKFTFPSIKNYFMTFHVYAQKSYDVLLSNILDDFAFVYTLTQLAFLSNQIVHK
jgi:hypothetical protein